ncbi:MAG TPA: helix-turn-helix domain-containing protein [Acidimicrobiia bacterium]|jgi:hypothetical protein|nr:helix-turn-helix domain-containing protein [Acidimicrobiia bacterium]
MLHAPNVRPLERRIHSMRAEGMSLDEIAARFDRSPDHISRVIEWSAIPRPQPRTGRVAEAMERRVLRLRFAGETHEQIGTRFRRSARFIRQVEGLAHYRRGLELLTAPS